MISIKHFLIGAGIAILPVVFWGYNKLELKHKGTLEVLASKREKIEYADRLKLLEIEYESRPTATPTPTAVPPRLVQKSDLRVQTTSTRVQIASAPVDIAGLIERYATMYGVNKDIMTHIAKCESGFRTNAISGPYAGIFQFVSSTWSSNRRVMGLDPNPNLRFDAEEAVKTAAFKMSRDGFGAWPACSRKAYTLLGLK